MPSRFPPNSLRWVISRTLRSLCGYSCPVTFAISCRKSSNKETRSFPVKWEVSSTPFFWSSIVDSPPKRGYIRRMRESECSSWSVGLFQSKCSIKTNLFESGVYWGLSVRQAPQQEQKTPKTCFMQALARVVRDNFWFWSDSSISPDRSPTVDGVTDRDISFFRFEYDNSTEKYWLRHCCACFWCPGGVPRCIFF